MQLLQNLSNHDNTTDADFCTEIVEYFEDEDCFLDHLISCEELTSDNNNNGFQIVYRERQYR